MESPVVFISYSHDSDQHREMVLSLAERLRDDGYESRIDQYVNGTPDETWPRWMMNQLDEAAFVLMVCTETYYRRFRGREMPPAGRGVDWEGAIITQQVYDSYSQTPRFVPVRFAPNRENFIPEPLRGRTCYTLNSQAEYEALCRVLDGVAGVEPRPVGKWRRRTRRHGESLCFGDETRSPSKCAGDVQPDLSNLPGEKRKSLAAGRPPQFACIGGGTYTVGVDVEGVQPLLRRFLVSDAWGRRMLQRRPRPLHTDPFRISQTCVTNAEFWPFVRENPVYWPCHWGPQPSGRSAEPFTSHIRDMPAVNITVQAARQYCIWAHARLPFWYEWEVAAAGCARLAYPWGNAYEPARCNGCESGRGELAPVGAYGDGNSTFSVAQMCGNVFEWVVGLLDHEFELRGGSFMVPCEIWGLTYAFREESVHYSAADVGFRVVSLRPRAEH